MVEVERLGDHFHARLQKAVGHRRALGIAGDEQDFQIRPGFARLIGDLAAVHAGQADVGDQQIDPLARAQDFQARRAIDGFERPIALLAQHLHDHAAHDRLVLDHQHGLAGGGMSRPPRPLTRADVSDVAMMARQIKPDRRSLPHLAVDASTWPFDCRANP